MPPLTLSSAPSPTLTAALAYAARGWHVLPLHGVQDGMCACGDPACPSPGKHPIAPLVPRGLHQATTFAPLITSWWQQYPDANVAIRTGTCSGLLVLDIDAREEQGRDGPATWRRLLAEYAEGQAPDTAEAITGSGGRHLLFALPADLTISSQKDHLGPGVEVKAEHGYIVAPPSSHRSGRAYAWDTFQHPDDTPPAPLPAWLLPLLRTRALPDPATTTPRLAATLGPLEVEELRHALATIPADDRDLWIRIGMALHATGDDDAGFTLWDTWSQTSAKYRKDDAVRNWRSFKERPDGVSVATLYATAHQHGWQRPPLALLAQRAGVVLPDLALPTPAPLPTIHIPTTPAPPPDHPLLAPLPGALQAIAEYALATAPHPVPLYAASAALALGSVLAARRYATSGNNYASLFLLTVGKSGTGKEHVRTVIEDVLHAVGRPELIGANGFTSAAAVHSALLTAPQQVAVIDEMGQWLAAASGSGESARRHEGVITTLMEVFGRLHTRTRTSQYATHALTDRQKSELGVKVVERPALTLQGMTTPATWFGAMSGDRIASGFLNRFLVLDGSSTPRGDYQSPAPIAPPPTLTDWAAALLAPRGNLDTLALPTNVAPPVVLTILPGAARQFAELRRRCNKWADELEQDGLGEMPMRTAEQAMRLALIAALAESPHAQTVDPHHAAWAVAVAQHSISHLVDQVHERMVESPTEKVRKALLSLLREAGARGLTAYEIARARVFAGTPRKDREEAVAWTIETEAAEWSVVRHGDAGGRPRRALVAREFSQFA